MAIAIASSASANNNAANRDVVVDKPSGLAEGDLLVACVIGGLEITEVTLPSGWTSIAVSSAGSTRGRMMYKVAEASDVAASTFTFSGAGGSSGTPVMLGLLLRVTGHAVPAVTPSSVKEDNISTDLSNIVTFENIGTLTPVVADHLLVMMLSTASGAVASHSGYSITGPTNPTWTEYYDQGYTSTDDSMGVAAAVLNNATAITECAVTLSRNAGSGVILAHFAPQKSATGTTSLLAETPVMFAPTASSGTTGTTELIETNPTVNNPTGTVDNFRWTNESDTTTTWTNES